MSRPAYSISAPSRLHFGLFSVGDLVERKFGGIGLMIQSPRTTLRISTAAKFNVLGDKYNRVREFAQSWLASYGQLIKSPVEKLDELCCEIEIVEQPHAHQGLGSGTQLAMATAMALSHYFELTLPTPDELALTMRRAKRSAIGTNGFFTGGFLVDRGNSIEAPVAPLDFQVDFPEWPILIALAKDKQGVFGAEEVEAFDKIPNVTPDVQQQMIDRVNNLIVPAVVASDYDSFSTAVYDFGYQSGMFYKDVQGGPYNGTMVTDLVNSIREFGVNAVGQSSWGPCVFAICKDKVTANNLYTNLKDGFESECDLRITSADNRGVVMNALSIESGRSN